MDTLSPPMGVWDFRLQPWSAFPIKYFKRKSKVFFMIANWYFLTQRGDKIWKHLE